VVRHCNAAGWFRNDKTFEDEEGVVIEVIDFKLKNLETLGLSMEPNDDILVQTTSLQTIARIKV